MGCAADHSTSANRRAGILYDGFHLTRFAVGHGVWNTIGDAELTRNLTEGPAPRLFSRVNLVPGNLRRVISFTDARYNYRAYGAVIHYLPPSRRAVLEHGLFRFAARNTFFDAEH